MKKSSENQKAHYTRYANEDRGAKNKARKIARHLKLHPNDKQAAACTKPTISGARTPKGKGVQISLDKTGKMYYAGGKLSAKMHDLLRWAKFEKASSNEAMYASPKKKNKKG